MADLKSQDERSIWIEILKQVAQPVLTNCAAGQLKARMPAEAEPSIFGTRAAEALARISHPKRRIGAPNQRK